MRDGLELFLSKVHLYFVVVDDVLVCVCKEYITTSSILIHTHMKTNGSLEKKEPRICIH